MKLKSIKPTATLGLLAGALTALLATTAANAVDQTWDNGAATGNWNLADANFGGIWTAGNTAVFGGSAGSTVTINASGVSAAGVTFNVNNDIIAQSGSNILTLTGTGAISVGSGLTATINAPLAGTSGVVVNGGGTLNLGGISTIDGGGDGAKGLIVGSTSAGNTVNLSSGGTMGTISANRRSLYIGSTGSAGGLTTSSNNVVNISTAGSVTAPSFNASGNGGRVTIGYASDANELNVSNGAYVAQTNGGGTNTWDMGVLAGADNNKLTVSGTNSTIYFGSNQFLNVGAAGDGNSATISAGGYLKQNRIGVGMGGGDNNYELITGAGSRVYGSGGSNAWFEVGSTAGSVGNSVRVENGGTLEFGGSGTARRFAVGSVATADSNFIRVTGPTSTANLVHTGIPLAVGGYATGSTMTDGGTSNHLDVSSGATLNMTNLDPDGVGPLLAPNAYISTGSTAIVLLGTNSAFNLGDGSGISTAIVGTTTNFASGVYLKNASGVLNFNSGRLTAGVTGNLVSGAGSVVLGGPAYISSATGFSNTISTAISGSGSLIKEGAGTLTLSNASVTYSGSTTVSEGTLDMTASGLSVGSSSFLKGNGTLIGAVAMTNNSTFAYEMNSGAVASSNLLKINGTVSLVSTTGNKIYLTLDDLAVTDAAFTTGTKLSLINYASGTASGFFYGATALAEGGSFDTALNKWTINYSDSIGGSNFIGTPTGSFINLTAGALTAIPEPGSLLALGCLVGSGAFLRSRRRTK
jgi:autotransporter-associated beta strand protein